MITLSVAAIISIMLGFLVFKLTIKLFVLSIRLVLFGLTATLVFLPIMLGMMAL